MNNSESFQNLLLHLHLFFNFNGVTGGGASGARAPPQKNCCPFCLFQKCFFRSRHFFNESNVLTSEILERSERRTKIYMGISEVVLN